MFVENTTESQTKKKKKRDYCHWQHAQISLTAITNHIKGILSSREIRSDTK